MDFIHFKGNIHIPLYKYYGNVNYAKDAIMNHRIHLEFPNEYNDIYDSSISISDAFLNCIHTKNLFQLPSFNRYLISIPEAELTTIKRKNPSASELIEHLHYWNKDIDRSKLKDEIVYHLTMGENILQTDTYKISCFSENNTSLLMWAYYAKNYSGVCLRFNMYKDSNLSKHCQKVQYTDHYIYNDSYNNYFRKSMQWSHEQEWRIVCETPDDYISTNSIDAVFLGARMAEATIHDLISLGKNQNLEVYKMVPSSTKYEIYFEKLL